VLAGADLPPPSEDLRSELKTYPQKVVFETNRDGNWELYLVNADGSSPVNLTQTLAIDELYPKPSPDGTKIAYVADQGEGEHRVRDVHVMNSDGTDRVKIADNAREPCWSPDGKSVAYLKGEFEKYNLQDFATRGVYIHELASGQTPQHPNAKIEHLYTLNWPVGGKWLVATVHGGMGLSHAIVAIATDGDRVVDLKLGGCRPNVRFDARKITWGHSDFCAGVADLDLTADTPRATNIHNIVESTDPVETYHVTWSPYRPARLVAHGDQAIASGIERGLGLGRRRDLAQRAPVGGVDPSACILELFRRPRVGAHDRDEIFPGQRSGGNQGLGMASPKCGNSMVEGGGETGEPLARARFLVRG